MLLSLSLAKNHSATNKSILLYLSSSFSRNKVNSSSRTSAVTTTAAVSFFSSSSGGSSSSSPTPLSLRHSHLLSTATTTSELFSLSSLMTAGMIKRSTMSSDNYQAWRVEEQEDGSFIGDEKTLSIKETLLPSQGKDESNNSTVLIKVTHSSLNYKDALSSTGKKGGVTRNFPHTPGIDAAGYIVDADGDIGESVLVTGYVRIDFKSKSRIQYKTGNSNNN